MPTTPLPGSGGRQTSLGHVTRGHVGPVRPHRGQGRGALAPGGAWAQESVCQSRTPPTPRNQTQETAFV
eukprot:3065958-Rhodomonas_salina.2